MHPFLYWFLWLQVLFPGGTAWTTLTYSILSYPENHTGAKEFATAVMAGLFGALAGLILFSPILFVNTGLLIGFMLHLKSRQAKAVVLAVDALIWYAFVESGLKGFMTGKLDVFLLWMITASGLTALALTKEKRRATFDRTESPISPDDGGPGQTFTREAPRSVPDR